MHFGSPMYILMVALLLGMTGGIYCFLRRRSYRFRCYFILSITVLNVLQHFLKFLIYPPYFGMGFTLYSTAYNMCALLIILSPAAILSNSRIIKNFVFFIGSAAGGGAILFPFWFLGIQTLGWDYFRFYICHALLFVTSFLPLILGMHKPRRRDYWQTGTGFLLALCIILVNNTVFMSMGLYPGNGGRDLYSQLLSVNPCMLMGPKDGLRWIGSVFAAVSPKVFTGSNPSGRYVPILWYALPVYAGISILTYLVFSLMELQVQKNDADHSGKKSYKL